MTSPPHSILFLNGAGLPDWIWDGVREALGESYRTQVAPRPTQGEAGLRQYVDAAISSTSAERITLVAHSAGGVVAAEVAGLVPERIRGLLAISAIVPPPGGSFLTSMPIPNRWMLGAVMRLAGTRPPESAIRKSLAHGLDEPTIDRLVADVTPESQGFYRDRIGTQPWNGLRGYVTTTGDRELSMSLQRRFAAQLGPSWQRQLPTGHLSMLEDPRALSATISSFVDVLR